MKKVIGGFLAILLLLTALLLGTKAYFFSIGYTQPLVSNEQGIRYISKVEGKQFYVLNANSQWEPTFLAGVDIGLGLPGAFPGEYAVDYNTYFDWFTEISDMGSNVIRVYTPQTPDFYRALYDYNRVAATPLYLMQGIYMDETDVSTYGDLYAQGSVTIADMRQDIIDCVNMLHGNAIVGAKVGKASGLYRYDVSRYVIGWILGIECEAYLVDGTNNAHPEMNTFEGKYVYTENASPFEVFIAQMEELAIGYETEHYQMQRPVAFCNWITTDPLSHPNEPRATEDQATIDVEHIKARDTFPLGFFASYHVYPYYPDFMNFPSGDAQTDENSYYAYVKSLVDYHSMPVLVSEFGLPTARGVTHINHLSGLNQGGNSEQEQADGLVSMLRDIQSSGCMGGIVFAWQDEWFKTSWNTMDFDDSSARPKWHNVESSEENFGLIEFTAFPSVRIDGEDSDWSAADALTDDRSLSVKWDESYLYLRVAVDDLDGQAYIVPIDTIGGEGSSVFENARFTRNADFVLVIDGQDHTRLLVDPYYNGNYRLYGKELFDPQELLTYAVSGSGKFIDVQQVICNKLLMPLTGQTVPVQLWNTGKLVYGNSNPDSPVYNSLADFSAGCDFVEVRIPWMTLNFADPSSGKILANLHTDGGIGLETVSEIGIGFGRADEQDIIDMHSWKLPKWGAFSSYTQRPKLAYTVLSQTFPQYATYPLNMGEEMQDALRLRDTRLLYVRLDRQMRSTDLIIYILILALLLAGYLYLLLVIVNLRLNHVFRKRERERAHLRSLMSLPAPEMAKKLHMRYLRSAKGADMLSQFLTEENGWDSDSALIGVLREGPYPQWLQRKFASPDLMLTILIVRLTGLLRLRHFEDQILPLMQAHKENIDLQYAGFLALAMMGNRDSLLKLFTLPEYTKTLSYRSLKEIFHVYTGDKRFLYEKLLNAPDDYIRRIIIKSIGNEGFTDFEDRLIPLLTTADINLLCDLIRTLGQLKCAAAGERIAAQMQSDQWTLRNVAVVALAEIDVNRYWEQIIQGLKDREWWVRYNSAKALCKHVPLRRLMGVAAELDDKYATEILNFAIQETLMMNTGVTQA